MKNVTHLLMFFFQFCVISESATWTYEIRSPRVFAAPKFAKWDTTSTIRRMCSYYAKESTEYSIENEIFTSYSDNGVRIRKQQIVKSRTKFLLSRKYRLAGTDADPKSFPHMAAIGYGYGKFVRNALWQCGGSLISDQFVLSAAHCAQYRNIPAKWIRLGDPDLRSTGDKQTFNIIETHTHPGYRPPDKYHDILLFRVSPRVTFSTYVRPICLPTSTDEDIIDQDGTVAGYGYHDENLQRDYRLRKAVIKIIHPSTCEELYTQENGFRYGFNSSLAICAGDVNHKEDTCEGDSGGPLQVEHNSEQRVSIVVGITSFGPNICGNPDVPAVYTNVAHYISWIQKIVWPEDTIT